jgi:hypothetical protein
MKHLPVLDPPTPEYAQSLIRAFEKENVYVESALSALVKQFPSNTDKTHVLLKVVTINALYGTQIRDVYTATDRIVECAIEEPMKTGDAAIVNQISEMHFRDKVRYNYSFATKYCSWHEPDLYPIYDSRVAFCLHAYRKQDHFALFTQDALWDYKTFRNVIKAFREHYGLTDFSFKKIDEFLFQLGNKYFAAEGIEPEEGFDARVTGADVSPERN